MKEENNKMLSDAPPEEESARHLPFQIPVLKRENTLGSKIAEARKKNGLNQHQVVVALGQYGYTITDALSVGKGKHLSRRTSVTGLV